VFLPVGHAGGAMNGLEEEILEVERLLGLTTRHFVRTRLVLLLSDLQQVSDMHSSLNAPMACNV
jgi:hypothetical protein